MDKRIWMNERTKKSKKSKFLSLCRCLFSLPRDMLEIGWIDSKMILFAWFDLDVVQWLQLGHPLRLQVGRELKNWRKLKDQKELKGRELEGRDLHNRWELNLRNKMNLYLMLLSPPLKISACIRYPFLILFCLPWFLSALAIRSRKNFLKVSPVVVKVPHCWAISIVDLLKCRNIKNFVIPVYLNMQNKTYGKLLQSI